MPVLEGASFAPAARRQAASRCGFRQPLPARRHHGSDQIHHPNAFARDEEGCRMFPRWTRQSSPPAGRADGVSRAERVRSVHATTRRRAGSRAPIDCSASAEAFEQRVVEPCSDFSRAPLTSRLVQREAVAGGIDETDRSRGSAAPATPGLPPNTQEHEPARVCHCSSARRRLKGRLPQGAWRYAPMPSPQPWACASSAPWAGRRQSRRRACPPSRAPLLRRRGAACRTAIPLRAAA